MLKFSLIIATIHRTDELNNLFSSLALQNYGNLECIVVDQNLDNRAQDIADRWRHGLDIRILPSKPGLSRARNIGLAAATGDIIAFPDDDCWYSLFLLKRIAFWFDEHPEFDIHTVGALDGNGESSGNRWPQDRCEIKPINAFRTTFSSTIFIRRTPVTAAATFDEALGVGSGTRFGCGEETDYVLRLLGGGVKGYFDRTLHICHPKRDMLSGEVDGMRALRYGMGMGHVLRKHSEGFLAISFIVYDLLRSCAAAARGSLQGAKLCLGHAQGIAEGYFPRFARKKWSVADSNPRPSPVSINHRNHPLPADTIA